ncbi:hypothetical protein BPUTEOMOX_1068 [methanotrophic endosymbiont of Bathymodiolus puteoserpentis (Logatchev)]|nr:hypothetical protein BPUTEOMOX_1068 [methanotrophic endosymbiont of Bathymodiolus puteoserpentis (Logatchev)]
MFYRRAVKLFEGTVAMQGFGHSRGGRRAYWGAIDSPRGESIFVT